MTQRQSARSLNTHFLLYWTSIHQLSERHTQRRELLLVRLSSKITKYVRFEGSLSRDIYFQTWGEMLSFFSLKEIHLKAIITIVKDALSYC